MCAYLSATQLKHIHNYHREGNVLYTYLNKNLNPNVS